LPALAPLPPPSCGNEEVEEEECGLLCDKFHFSVFGVGRLNNIEHTGETSGCCSKALMGCLEGLLEGLFRGVNKVL
jgi:hypothetical protein